MRQGDGFVIMLDLTRKSSIEDARYWFDTLSDELGEKVPKVLAGHKCDYVDARMIPKEIAMGLAEEM